LSSEALPHAEAQPALPQRHVVAAAEAGARVDKLLGELPGITSREMARRLIAEGAATLNGETPKPADRVRADDVIDYTVPPVRPSRLKAQEGPLEVLYEDRWVAVVNKPPDLPVHPGPGHRQHTLVNYLLWHCTDLSGIGGQMRPGIVHRLDKDTSGVLVVAKTDEAHINLARQFKARTIERSYLAVEVGAPERDGGTVSEPIGRHRSNPMKRRIDPAGKHAVTHWRVLRRDTYFTLLRLRLETGRTHQIRVHMWFADMPVLGDPLYGGRRYRGLDIPLELRARLDRFRRQALHAERLGFHHPMTGEHMSFQAPPPEDMQRVMALVLPDPTVPA